MRGDHRDRAPAPDDDARRRTSRRSTPAASRIAIDDFGTGYASLTYLSQYPIDVIKIDRSFITEAASQDDGLVAGIIALATTLGIAVTAEGVEHPPRRRRLRQMGCPSAQGWLYSAAVPAEDVVGLLGHIYPHP